MDERLVKALHNIGISVPTNIQNDALPVLLAGKSAIIASETGNGKTIAYLLPVVQKILQTKANCADRKLMRPLAVIGKFIKRT